MFLRNVTCADDNHLRKKPARFARKIYLHNLFAGFAYKIHPQDFLAWQIHGITSFCRFENTIDDLERLQPFPYLYKDQ